MRNGKIDSVKVVHQHANTEQPRDPPAASGQCCRAVELRPCQQLHLRELAPLVAGTSSLIFNRSRRDRALILTSSEAHCNGLCFQSLRIARKMRSNRQDTPADSQLTRLLAKASIDRGSKRTLPSTIICPALESQIRRKYDCLRAGFSKESNESFCRELVQRHAHASAWSQWA